MRAKLTLVAFVTGTHFSFHKFIFSIDNVVVYLKLKHDKLDFLSRVEGTSVKFWEIQSFHTLA